MAWIDGKYCVVDEARGVYSEVAPLVRNAKDGSVLALVPGGEFEMGEGSAKHRVFVDAYYIGVYCVTNAQYARFIKKGRGRVPDNSKWKDAAFAGHPVTDVCWDDAEAYAKWAGCELPTEAQWERAARGPEGLVYPWGDGWDAGGCRNDKNKGSGQTCAVWEYPAGTSGYGTMNQSGNVMEWCRDWYGEYKTGGVQRNPVGPATGSHRVFRGGCWRGDDAGYFLAADRRWGGRALRSGGLGFRLVLKVE